MNGVTISRLHVDPYLRIDITKIIIFPPTFYIYLLLYITFYIVYFMYFVYFFLSIPFRTRWKQESKQSNRGDYLGRKVNGTDDNNLALSRYERTMERCATRRRCKISTSVWCKEGGWMMVDESVREREFTFHLRASLPPSIRNSKSFPVVAAATWQESGFNWVRSFRT